MMMNKQFRFLLARDYSSLSIGVLITILTAMSSTAAKNLVIIAGPRQERIQEFFYEHATASETSTEKSETMRGWRWPVLRDEDIDQLQRDSAMGLKVSRHNIFDLLFRSKNDSVTQEMLMEAIRGSWENSTHGIILGEERFGKVGINPVTSDDALKIIYRLMENLSIRAKDVTLVLIYDTPRIEQWASIWHQQPTYGKYSDFLCKSDEAEERFEYLDTTMNPFKLSTIYRDHGWNVIVLDEGGVRGSGFDTSHAIACNVMGVSCEEGWITGLKEETSKPLPSYQINELDDKAKQDLEEFFLLRDCLYKQDLQIESGQKEFQIVNQEFVWKNCRKHYSFELRDKVNDVNFFSNAVQSQKSCGDEIVDLSAILASTNTTSFENLLWSMIFASIFFLAAATGILFIRNKRGENIKGKVDGFSLNNIFWRKSAHSVSQETTDRPRSLCNACKFVRVDPNCIFCQGGRRQTSSDMGKEIERRIKQHQAANLVGVNDEAEDMDVVIPQVSCLKKTAEVTSGSVSPSSNTVDLHQRWPPKSTASKDASHFDMNLRRTRSQSKNGRAKKDEEKQKSKVVRKLKQLLVLKTEARDKIFAVTEPRTFSPGDNLQVISFDEDDNTYV